MSILKQLNQRPIAYYPVYREITGSTTAGILLSQLMYWFRKKDKIFKTDKEIMEEILLTEKELRTAKSKIKKLDFITVKVEGVPAKTYYKIDWEKYEKALNDKAEQDTPKGQNSDSKKGETRNAERAEQETPKGQSSDSRKGETYIVKSLTETTTETTTESKKENKEKNPTLTQLTQQKIDKAQGRINQDALAEWLDYKKYKSIQPITKAINFLSKFDFQTQQQIIDTSIMNGYQGIFAPTQQKQKSSDNTNIEFALQHNVFDIIESIPDDVNTDVNTQEVLIG